MIDYASGRAQLAQFKAMVWSAHESLRPKEADQGVDGPKGISPERLEQMRASRPREPERPSAPGSSI